MIWCEGWKQGKEKATISLPSFEPVLLNWVPVEKFHRRIFLLIHKNTLKSEAIYPKTKIFGEKNRFSKIPVGEGRKTKMAAGFRPSHRFCQ